MVSEWLQRYHTHPGEPTVQSLASYLTGAAADFFAVQSSIRTAPWTLDELVEGLAVRFDDESRSLTALRELKAARQGKGEGIATFNQRYLSLATAAGALNDADTIARYIGAVNAATKKIIADNKFGRQQGTTLVGLMDDVMTEVRAISRMEEWVESVAAGTTTGQGPSVSYREPIAQYSDPMELGTMHMQQQCGPDQCLRCRGYGHWARDCTTPADASQWTMRIQCRGCKGWGHKQDDCYTVKHGKRVQSPRQAKSPRYVPPHQRAQSPAQQAQSPRAGQQSKSPSREQGGGAGFENLRNYRPKGQGNSRKAAN